MSVQGCVRSTTAATTSRRSESASPPDRRWSKSVAACSRSVALAIAVGLLLAATAARSAPRPDSPRAIDIKIESTRPRMTAGAALGVTANVTNVSNSIVYLHEQHITMSPPPELVGDWFPGGWWAHFPTELHSGKGDDFYNAVVAIRPGESLKAFWNANPVNGQSQKDPKDMFLVERIFQTLVTELGFLFFTPGDYTITISAKYWIDPDKPPAGRYHTLVESKTVTVESPQSVILFGASVGGLIAYFILPKARRRLIEATEPVQPNPMFKPFRTASVDFIGILGAVLLSAIVTILLARISETQFLIRVTVADFWGAVAIGFVANAIGVELINKLIRSQSESLKTIGRRQRPSGKRGVKRKNAARGDA